MSVKTFEEGVQHVKKLQRVVDDLRKQYRQQMVDAVQDPCTSEEDVMKLAGLILLLERNENNG